MCCFRLSKNVLTIWRLIIILWIRQNSGDEDWNWTWQLYLGKSILSKLSWCEVIQVKTEIQTDVDQVLKKYQDVMKNELGTVQGVKAKIYVDTQEKPR